MSDPAAYLNTVTAMLKLVEHRTDGPELIGELIAAVEDEIRHLYVVKPDLEKRQRGEVVFARTDHAKYVLFNASTLPGEMRSHYHTLRAWFRIAIGEQ